MGVFIQQDVGTLDTTHEDLHSDLVVPGGRCTHGWTNRDVLAVVFVDDDGDIIEVVIQTFVLKSDELNVRGQVFLNRPAGLRHVTFSAIWVDDVQVVGHLGTFYGTGWRRCGGGLRLTLKFWHFWCRSWSWSWDCVGVGFRPGKTHSAG